MAESCPYCSTPLVVPDDRYPAIERTLDNHPEGPYRVAVWLAKKGNSPSPMTDPIIHQCSRGVPLTS